MADDINKYFQHSAVFVHPADLLREIIAVQEKVGAHKFIHSPEYKKDFELFIGACFTYGARNLTGKEWLIRPGEEPPDFSIMSVNSTGSEKTFEKANVELVTVPLKVDEQNDKFAFAKSVIAKKFSKLYKPADKTWLLIFLNSSSARQLAGFLKDTLRTQNKYPSIWSIYFLSMDDFIFALYEIFPGSGYLEYNFSKETNVGLKFPHPAIDKARNLFKKIFSETK